MLKTEELNTVVCLLERRMEELRADEELVVESQEGAVPCRTRVRTAGREAVVSLYEEAMRTARMELMMRR